jgi:hypothetical protein
MNRQTDYRWLTYVLPAVVSQFEPGLTQNISSTQDLRDQVELFRKLLVYIKDFKHSRFHVLDELFLNDKVMIALL